MSGPIVTRRAMIAGGLMAGVALAANSRRPAEAFRMIGEQRLDPLFPKRVADWTFERSDGLVLPSSEERSDHFYTKLITRYYGSPTQLPVMLLIAYSDTQDGTLQVHRPEACYPAAGYQLLREMIIPLSAGHGVTVPGHFISAESVSRVEQLIYWTRIGNDFPTRWWQQHWAVAKENLKGRVPDGVLIRLSTSAPDDRSALLLLRRFLAPFLETLSPSGRRLLLGARGGGGLPLSL